MPQVIIPSEVPSLDGSIRSQAYAFIDKLRKNDTLPGLHIEPIELAADKNVRTGRVNRFWRAVLIKLTGSHEESRYIYLGTFPHDEAIAYARNVVFQRNPRSGSAEVIRVDLVDAAPRPAPSSYRIERHAATRTEVASSDTVSGAATTPVLQRHGTTFEDLLDIGVAAPIAHEAVLAADPDRLLEVAMAAPSAFQTDALLMLGDGSTIAQVRAAYDVRPVEGGTENDTEDDLIEALDRPASQLEFTYLVDDDDLRAAIEDENFARWRVFLHPQQRAYAEARTNGAFRLSGGAGTGKTVVLLHRARHLHRAYPAARIVLTTYNTTLAAALRAGLRALDKNIRPAEQLGDPGIYICTIDSASWTLVTQAGRFGLDMHGAAGQVLGERRSGVVQAADPGLWEAALGRAGGRLPDLLRNVDFLETEYGYVVVPGQIVSRDQYLVARRPGRGVSLGRSQRHAVWDVIEAYRALSAQAGATDYDEKAMLAAAALDSAAGSGGRRVADHVLADEAQDFTPSRLLLLRALAGTGPNDLFLAEDSQQRIYRPRTVLSRYGIRVTGRSRRLQLNYRTTAQNLDYATGILSGQETADLEDAGVDDSAMRSARSGPRPLMIGRGTRDEAYDAGAETLRGWLADGTPPETIAVLARTRAQATWLARRLDDDGIPSRFVDKGVESWGGRVATMTMHRAKGMEFRNVLLFGATAAATRPDARVPEGDRPEALQRERALLYVAATRARDHLAVVWDGEKSALLPEPAALPEPAVVAAPETGGGYTDRDELAREIHDTVGQSFAHIALTASVVEVDESAVPAIREQMASIRSTVQRGREQLHDLLAELRTGADGHAPVSFDDLTRLLARFKNEGVRISSNVSLSESETASAALAQACYGIVQESVTNAMKYAADSPIDITLRAAPSTGVTLVVFNPLAAGAGDGGPGSDGSVRGGGSGLSGMAERAESLGGTFSAEVVAGRFVVDARIPWS
ncbi:3'-5' exonuclease [Myceligenerans xiligouense]|uniref:3'-5' exonuclease n=1 Tax=Myceligenerans xiligouense TaxID=253184 RepID=UPI000F4EBE1B|nr:3'-5' exonuclease [Myceligenerans xiligouense]